MYTDDGLYLVRDLSSRNGTFVNGELIGGPRALQPGDRINVGSAAITFCLARSSLDALLSDQTRQLKRALRRQVVSKEALTALQEPLLAIFVGVGFFLSLVYLKMPLGAVLVMGSSFKLSGAALWGDILAIVMTLTFALKTVLVRKHRNVPMVPSGCVGALLGSLPVAIFYSFFVEHYVSSLTGAVKE